MAYCDSAAVIKAIGTDMYGRVTAPQTGETNTATEILNGAIAKADSKIDSYLRSIVSTLPLDTPPECIVTVSVQLTVYYLHGRAQFVDRPEWVLNDFDDAMNFLKDLANGKATIEIDTDDETLNDKVSSDAYERRTSRSTY